MERGSFKVVLASGNRGKLAEIRPLLQALGLEILPQSQLGIAAADESGADFRDNALLKARHAAACSGLPAIADDSGLEVPALAGRPGVHSARYAGPSASDADNVAKLLRDLHAVPPSQRAANFRCVAVYVGSADDDAPLVAEGAWRGMILEAPCGGAGFGYDPVFYDPERGKTAAQMSSDEKNLVSHRGQAFRELTSRLALRLAGGVA